MTIAQMISVLQKRGKPYSSFRKGTVVKVNNKMVKNYTYVLSTEPGTNLEFDPYATPEEMLCMGVFEGKYLNDCLTEFPSEWFYKAIALDKLRPDGADPTINAFEVKSRQPLSAWRESGWVPNSRGKKGKYDVLSDPDVNKDERGWFQWYCRYWMGRRIPELDTVQIARWRAFTRHAGQIKKNCTAGDLSCRPVQRQALLQWGRNPFI